MAKDIDAPSVMSRLNEEILLETEAQARDDIPTANRHARRARAALDILSMLGEPGVEAMRQLLHSDFAPARTTAAFWLMKIDPDLAIPVLGRVLAEDHPGLNKLSRIMMQSSAAHALADHFGFYSWEDEKLVGPLRAFGIELPPRPVITET